VTAASLCLALLLGALTAHAQTPPSLLDARINSATQAIDPAMPGEVPIPSYDKTMPPADDDEEEEFGDPTVQVPTPPQFLKRKILPVAAQGKPKYDDEMDFQVRTELPSPEILFRRDSEKDVFERIRQEARKRLGTGRVYFPEQVPLTKEKYTPRSWEPRFKGVEPAYVCHGRLLFEQPNFERQGWDVGVLTPGVCLGIFYYDVLTLPYRYWTRPLDRTECSAGKCLPGDPTPFYLYPPEFSVTGLLGAAATYTAGAFIFP